MALSLTRLNHPHASLTPQTISSDFGVLDDALGLSLRATVIVGPDGTVRSLNINDLPVGRNVDEVLRLVQAFKFSDENPDVVCPASWTPGSKTMVPTAAGVKAFFQ